MDELLAGAQTPEEAIRLHKQLRTLLLKGGFDLQKWQSSSTMVMDAIPEELHEPSQTKNLNQDSTTSHPKALARYFLECRSRCILCFCRCSNSHVTTKRSILSDIVRCLDVLSWLSPSTIVMKVLLQQLWELRIGWDEECH